MSSSLGDCSPLWVKGVAEELGVKGYVRQVVLVLDRAQQVHVSGTRGTELPCRRLGEEGGGKTEEEGSCTAGSSYLELELLLSPLEILGLVGTN